MAISPDDLSTLPSGRYVSLPIETDVAAIQEDMYDHLQTLIPGWAPADGNLDVWLIQAVAAVAADLRLFCSDVPDIIFRYFGEYIVGVIPKLATYASFNGDWTVEDDQGYTIPAGTLVGVRQPDGNYAGFEVSVETIIPPGSTVATGVPHTATEPGAASSGLSVAVNQIDLIDSLPWVVSIIGAGFTAGGSDGETDEEYMDRLVQEIQLMSPRPILPNDFAVMARKINGVDRAWPYNLWDLPTATGNHEKTITVVVANENGDPVDATKLAEVDDYLQSLRETNFVVYVTNPRYVTINVTASVTSYPNRDQAQVAAEVTAALNAYIAPKDWGAVRTSTGDPFGTPVYRPQNVVRYNDVIACIDNVDSVDFVTALTLNGGTIDVAFPAATAGQSPVTLPKLGTSAITVTVPVS